MAPAFLMKVQRQSLSRCAEVKAALRDDPPVVAMDLPLEVVSSLVVGCFLGTIARWRGFF